MLLGELRQALVGLEDDEYVFTEAFGEPHSYRGYYDQVSFPFEYEVSVQRAKEYIQLAFDNTFYGWKGGEFTYDANTPANMAYEGECGESDDMQLEVVVADMLREYANAHQVKKKKTKRKTKAEIAEEQAKAKQAHEDEFVEGYSTRLIRVMYDFYNLRHAGFGVTRDDSSDEYHFTAGHDYSGAFCDDWIPETPVGDLSDVEYMLERVEDAVTAFRQYEKELAEMALKKQAALAKLTKEDKEILGL